MQCGPSQFKELLDAQCHSIALWALLHMDSMKHRHNRGDIAFCDHNRSQALQWSTKSPNHLLTWTILNIILILIHLALAGDLGVSRWESWNISKIPASARWVDSGTGSATDCGRLWSGSTWGWTRHERLLQENPQAGNWVLVWIYWIHVVFLWEEGWNEIAKMILYNMSRYSMFCLLILLGCFLILWPITTNKMPSVGSSPTTRARICMNLLLVYIVLCVCVCESIRFVKMARGNVWLQSFGWLHRAFAQLRQVERKAKRSEPCAASKKSSHGGMERMFSSWRGGL